MVEWSFNQGNAIQIRKYFHGFNCDQNNKKSQYMSDMSYILGSKNQEASFYDIDLSLNTATVQFDSEEGITELTEGCRRIFSTFQ